MEKKQSKLNRKIVVAPAEQKSVSNNWMKFQQKIKTSGVEPDLNHRQTKQFKSVTKKLKKINQNDQSHVDEVYNVNFPVPNSFEKETPVIAIDCEMVNCVNEYGNTVQALARLSVINYNGHVLIDEHYKPTFKIINYLTRVSGITPYHLKNAGRYDEKKQQEIINLFKNKIIVGHSLQNDFKALNLSENISQKRDISTVSFLRQEGRPQALKKLCLQHLGQVIQEGSHCSIVDSRAALYVYRKLKVTIDSECKFNNYAYAHKAMLEDTNF